MKHLILLNLVLFSIISLHAQKVRYEKVDTVILEKDKPKYNDSIYVIHLTDIHLKHNKSKRAEKFSYFCDIISKRYKAENTYIVITGDFADSNNEDKIIEEFTKAKNIIKTKLEDKNFKVFVCPGNHDYSKDWRKYSESKKTAFKNIFLLPENFPDTSIFPKHKLLFVGLNSMYGADTSRNAVPKTKQIMKVGNIGKNPKNELKTVLSKYPKYSKIVYMHHAVFNPVDTIFIKKSKLLTRAYKRKQLIDDKNEMCNILSIGNVDLLLNGHRHLKFAFEINNIQIVESSELQKEEGYYVISFAQNYQDRKEQK